MKFGLLIQGPMISSGKSGSGELVYSFNCNPTVERNARRARELGMTTVLSTWSTQKVSSQIHSLIEDVVQLVDPFRDASGAATAAFKRDRTYNSERQWFGIIQGLQRMRVLEVDVVVRIRTDQSLSLDLLLEELGDSVQQDRLLFPRNFVPFPDVGRGLMVSDFFFGGLLGRVSRVMTLVSLMGSIWDPHQDLARAAYLEGCEPFSSPHPSLCFRSLYCSDDILKLVDVFWKERATAASQELMSSLWWRGTRFTVPSLETLKIDVTNKGHEPRTDWPHAPRLLQYKYDWFALIKMARGPRVLMGPGSNWGVVEGILDFTRFVSWIVVRKVLFKIRLLK